MRPLFLLFAVTVLPLCATAQPGDGEVDVMHVSPQDALPPLDKVIRQALQFSPRLGYQKALVAQKSAELQRTRRGWMDGIIAGVSTTYGSYGNTVLDEINAGMTAGFTVRMSLFDLFGQKSKARIFQQSVNMASHKREEAAMEVKQVIISMYNRLELHRRMVRIKSSAYQAADVHRQMAESEFAQGDIPVSELARVAEIAEKTRAEYENARFEYVNAYAQLENMIGASLSTL